MSRTSPQNLAERKSPNVVREVLAFLMRHWRREAWCVAAIAVSMAGGDRRRSAAAGVFRASGRRGGERRGACDRAACGGLRDCRDGGPRRGAGAGAVSRVPGHRAADGAADDAHGQRRLLAGAALLDRLAREQLCRLDRAADYARHLGRRHDGRHAAARAAAGGAGADRLSRCCWDGAGRRWGCWWARARSPTSASRWRCRWG